MKYQLRESIRLALNDSGSRSPAEAGDFSRATAAAAFRAQSNSGRGWSCIRSFGAAAGSWSMHAWVAGRTVHIQPALLFIFVSEQVPCFSRFQLFFSKACAVEPLCVAVRVVTCSQAFSFPPRPGLLFAAAAATQRLSEPMRRCDVNCSFG